jgi:hypothetical protein
MKAIDVVTWRRGESWKVALKQFTMESAIKTMLEFTLGRNRKVGLVTFMCASYRLHFLPFCFEYPPQNKRKQSRNLWNLMRRKKKHNMWTWYVRHKRKFKHNIRFKFKRRVFLYFSFFIVISGTSNVCHVTADCPQNAICEPRTGRDGQCVCRDGYFMKASGKSRVCIEIADYGELCYLDQQCAFRLGLHSECTNGQCSCKEGSHYIVNENACFKSSSE